MSLFKQQSDSQYWNNQYQFNQSGNQNQYMQSCNSQQEYYQQDSSQHNQYMQCQGSMSQPAMSGSHGDMTRECSLPCVSSEQNKDENYGTLDFTTLKNMLENREMSAPTQDIIVPQVQYRLHDNYKYKFRVMTSISLPAPEYRCRLTNMFVF